MGDRRTGAELSRRILHSDRVRLYETVRTAHLERARTLSPAAIVYRARRYDFDESLVEGLELVEASPVDAARILARSPLAAIEINEPLMLTSVRATALALAMVRWRRPWRPRPLTVTYAIGNVDPFAQTGGGWRRAVRAWTDKRLARFVWRHVDRIVFGTQAAADVYRDAFGGRGPRARVLIPALPARSSAVSTEPRGETVVFLGAFVERKGFPLLLEAWSHVRREKPSARLLILGKGELEDDARALADSDPSVELIVDPARAEIRRMLERSAVLVLPSQPYRGWREQVGLPIVEGLEQGCRIVTTEETGLASWLAEHGHGVIPAGGDAAALARAVVRQLEAGNGAANVVASLPELDGRLAADAWLFEPVTPSARR